MEYHIIMLNQQHHVKHFVLLDSINLYHQMYAENAVKIVHNVKEYIQIVLNVHIIHYH
jgi:hypothetical protein